MKKSTLWLLILLMAVTFGALIALQVRYLTSTAELAEKQFDDGVKRSLIQTVILLEENEALKFLAQTLEEDKYVQKDNRAGTYNKRSNDLRITDSVRTDWNKNSSTPSVRLSTGHGKATIEETSKFLREKFQLNFSRSKTILDQAVFRWLHESENRDISERVDFIELDEILDTYFKSNGVELPFFYSIVDNNNKVIYQCNKRINVAGNPTTDVYVQRL